MTDPKLNTFEKILFDGIKKGLVPAKEQAARDWFRAEAMKLRKHQVKENQLFREQGHKFKNRTAIGRLYMFHYDPKHKHDANALPHFDTLPVIIPFAPAANGFLGINLHYLPHIYRARMFDALYKIASNKRFDDTTKLKVSYDVLRGLTGTPYYAPCVKHYLKAHVRSRFIEIPPSQWDIVCFAPLERFSRGGTLAPMSKAEVWKDSRRIIREAGRK